MEEYESFGRCLQRVLTENGISASEAARLVGFRSRNSIFRILNDETSGDVDARFLKSLWQAMGDQWPQAHWRALENALHIKIVGLAQHRDDQAFCRAMCGSAELQPFIVETKADGRQQDVPMDVVLRQICSQGQWTAVICGCCDAQLTTLLSVAMNDAGSEGRLSVRHYIDVGHARMVRSILGALPLMDRVWYIARLVDEERCPAEMIPLYQLNIINLLGTLPDGSNMVYQLLQCDKRRFFLMSGAVQISQLVTVLDRYRFDLELLKPMEIPSGGPEDFVAYTDQYARLEKGCAIYSIKPDVHFNFVPTQLLYPAIVDGFQQAGIAAGDALAALVNELYRIHEGRVNNAFSGENPVHIVYSLTAMEQFMRTGVQSDHFFLQRAYTLEERREIVRRMLEHAKAHPNFDIRFQRRDLPEIRSEMTLYDGRGVLLLDGYTSYDLHDDHSEALITLPAFMQSFQRFYTEVLMKKLVLTREESLCELERLLQLPLAD